MPDCSISGCDRPHYGRGWCSGHWKRWKLHGDPLGGRPDNGEPDKFLEAALMYEGIDCLIWPFWRSDTGYARINRSRRVYRVTRLICHEIYGPPPSKSHQAAHSCGRGHEGCIAKSHLSWKTPKQNAADKVEHGTQTKGENHSTAKLTEDAVQIIRSLKGLASQQEIANRFGTTRENIRSIHSGRTWGWLSPITP